MSTVLVQNVSKVFVSTRGEPVQALRNVSFDVKPHEFFAIVGHSGCGKTTRLNLIAGFERPSEGRIVVDGQEVLRPSWERGVVFQKHVLFPCYTVHQNISFGMEMQGLAHQERERLVRYYTDLVGLKGFERKYPWELSGGMKQRVGIARSLASNPGIGSSDLRSCLPVHFYLQAQAPCCHRIAQRQDRSARHVLTVLATIGASSAAASPVGSPQPGSPPVACGTPPVLAWVGTPLQLLHYVPHNRTAMLGCYYPIWPLREERPCHPPCRTGPLAPSRWTRPTRVSGAVPSPLPCHPKPSMCCTIW